MKKIVLIMALPLLVVSGLAQTRNCLRVMPLDELIRTSSFIARVRVQKSSKANYKGLYRQLATLHVVEVIEGDFTLEIAYVLARSNVPCAEDSYTEGREMLVFLEPDSGLFRTVNFQHGLFVIEGEIVKGWRDKSNKILDKPFAEVREEILAILNPKNTPPQPAPPASKPPLF
ncbi:MAG: hypothetical protein AB1631_14435 [Acidobacteriota bacterium]